jgi:hypothetical protein
MIIALKKLLLCFFGKKIYIILPPMHPKIYIYIYIYNDP